MDSFLEYLLISSLSLSLYYLGYRVFMRREYKFQHLRYYLLFSMLLSIVLPLSNFKLYTSFLTKPQAVGNEKSVAEFQSGSLESVGAFSLALHSDSTPVKENEQKLRKLLTPLYQAVSSILLLGLIIRLFVIIFLSRVSVKSQEGKTIIFSSEKIESPFTFFHWIFLPKDFSERENNAEILLHEQVHASQLHSIDLLAMELLCMIMWFNPLVWLMKKSMRLVHEYIADDKVLNTGFNLFNYQALLINEVAEEKYISLSSGFNQSILKNRLTMMNKAKSKKDSHLRILILAPIVVFIFVAISAIKGQDVQNTDLADSGIITVVFDAGHGGKDSGGIGNGNIIEKDLTLSVIKTLMKRSSSYKNLRLIFTREDDEFMTLNQRTENPSDLFVSIHFNTSLNPESSGIECYIANESEYKEKSEAAGNNILAELKKVKGIKTQDSIREAPYYVLTRSKRPAILINLGYISNQEDLSFISDLNNQNLICDKILNAISKLDLKQQ